MPADFRRALFRIQNQVFKDQSGICPLFRSRRAAQPDFDPGGQLRRRDGPGAGGGHRHKGFGQRQQQAQHLAVARRAAEESGSAISALVLADQAEQLELDASEVYARMERRLSVMEEAIENYT